MIFYNIDDFRKWRTNKRGSVGLVPTLGGLHQGHISLIQKSILACENTVVSIFLNPSQFNEKKDLKTYPSSIEKDIKTLENLDVSALFVPDASELYSNDFSISVVENLLSRCKEGASRPGFFHGVLTVVTKLFNIIEPSVSFFGEKDPQQLLLIKKLCKDLNFNVEIVSCPTIREKNGLACSTRNQHLTRADRERAGILFIALQEAKQLLSSGEKNYFVVYNHITTLLLTCHGLKIDYISIANPKTLIDFNKLIGSNVLISLAVFLGNVRLIDSVFWSKKPII